MEEEKDWDFLDDGENENKDEKREIFDENGVNIFSKKSSEKTVEERIKTSRSLKIKNNRWNQVDYTEDFQGEQIVIDPHSYQYSSSYEDVEFEKTFQRIIENSKYKELLLGDEKTTINYQVINDIIIYCYAKLKSDYTMAQIFVLTCEYCGIGLMTMLKKSSTYIQMLVLEDLREISKLPDELLDNKYKLF